MKIIKVASIFPRANNLEHITNVLRFSPEKFGMHFVYDDINPQYVVVPNQIYTDEKIFKKYLLYSQKECIFIFFSGECVTPDMNLFDYAVAFDRNVRFGDRVARLSTCRFYSVSIFKEFLEINITKEFIQSKTKFCNFMYSHAYPIRDNLFNKIQEYKKVDSLGKHLNNTGIKHSRFQKDWRKLSIEDRLPYKFSIAAENAEFSGYTSEKIISCLEAHTVPIYWGDPTISEEFNPRAFINCSDYENFDHVLERVKEIDNDDELFYSILKEPWHTKEQLVRIEEENSKYDAWILNIFNQPYEKARRRPSGTYPDAYTFWFNHRYKMTFKQFIKSIF